MSKSVKNSRTTSRPPVDALQYEKLALSAFGLVERQLNQLDKLVTLAASIFRSPVVTREERQRQRKLLEVLIDTGEDYQREVEIDRELYQVIALDAKGVPQSCLTARHAANLLAKATQTAPESRRGIRATGRCVTGKDALKQSRALLRQHTDIDSPHQAANIKKALAPFLCCD